MASSHPQGYGLEEPPPRPTTPPVRKGFLLVLLVLSLAALVVYGVPYVAERAGYAWESGRSRAATETLARLEKAGVVSRANELFRIATVAVSPAVVNIQTQRFRRVGAVPGLPAEGGNLLGRGVESFGVGSGVIIDGVKGYVVTNNHVVSNVDRITVRLSQGTEVPARLVGADPKTDLAVLQIKGPIRVAAAWGDSDKLAIGDWVLAIGSPYMLDHTVTAGIVSATGRNNLTLPGMMDDTAYQDFIQTDAAINPGNSGGPLIDLNGRVVGINTAILTSASFLHGGDGSAPSGGFEGIGLAIPSSLARGVVESLIKNGKVERGFLGIAIGNLTPALARAYKLPDTRGAIVSGVHPGSPAEKAGLKIGDVIVTLNGKGISDPATLRLTAAACAPGTETPLQFYRDGEKRSVKVIIGEQPGETVPSGLTPFGFRVREFKSGDGPTVLLIDAVVRGGLAARHGLVPGLRILGVGMTDVHSLDEFEKAAAGFTVEKGLPLRVQTPDGRVEFVTLGGPGGPPR